MPAVQPTDVPPLPLALIPADDAPWTVAPVLAPGRGDEADDQVAINAPWLVHFKGGEVAIHALDEHSEAHIAASELDAGDDLLVVFDLHAPGITDKASQTDAQQKRALRKRKVRVVSPFVRSGGITLHPAGNPARAGADEELMMYWSLSGSENKTGRRSPSGQQTLAFTAGDRTLGTLRLHWDNDR
jgi:hypothetical protein